MKLVVSVGHRQICLDIPMADAHGLRLRLHLSAAEAIHLAELLNRRAKELQS